MNNKNGRCICLNKDWLYYESNGFGYKKFDLTIGGKDKFLNIEINNYPTIWIHLFWDKSIWGKHFI